MNNVDVAEMMLECVEQALKTIPPETVITWGGLQTAIKEYIITEEHEIKKAKEYAKQFE